MYQGAPLGLQGGRGLSQNAGHADKVRLLENGVCIDLVTALASASVTGELYECSALKGAAENVKKLAGMQYVLFPNKSPPEQQPSTGQIVTQQEQSPAYTHTGSQLVAEMLT